MTEKNFMFGIGLPELIVILAVALIVVGPEKLPELAKTVAKQVLELKKAANSLKDSLKDEEPEETKKPFQAVEMDKYLPEKMAERAREIAKEERLEGDETEKQQDTAPVAAAGAPPEKTSPDKGEGPTHGAA